MLRIQSEMKQIEMEKEESETEIKMRGGGPGRNRASNLGNYITNNNACSPI